MVSKVASCFLYREKVLFSLLMVFAILLPMNGVCGEDAKDKKDWEFLIEPYLLFANIKGDTSLRGYRDNDIDISNSDIFDNLKMGGMIHMEALHSSNWGVAFDYGFMDLEMDVPIGPIIGTFTSSVKQTTMELLVFKRINIDAGSVDVFAGARRWKNKIHVVLNQGALISLQRDENWVDAIIGVRGYFDIAEGWQLMVRGDVGGFNLESEFTAKTAAGIMYNITDSIILDIQYMALWVDYETGTPNTNSFFSYDTVTHGPAIGVIFKF